MHMLGAIIMASGFGSRMGQDKLLLQYRGKAFIEHIIEKVQACPFESIVLVVNSERFQSISKDYKIQIVLNANAHLGQSESIKAGLLHSPDCEGYMFFPADQPLLDVETILKLMAQFDLYRDKIIIPRYEGQPGSPVIFPAKYKSALLALKGDVGGREIVREHPEAVIYVDLENGYVLSDIDTWEEYQAILNEKYEHTADNFLLKDTVIIRGGGDIASGVIQALHRSGFRILVLEAEQPTAIRRKVSFCEAVYEKTVTIEGIRAICVMDEEEMQQAWRNGAVPLIIDTDGKYIEELKPDIVIDAILAKRNMGTNREMAPITIALGPGFEAGRDVDIVIETMRGHRLGSLIQSGYAIDNTGIPGEIMGFSKERVIYSPIEGIIQNVRDIGDKVQAGETIAMIGSSEIRSPLDGILRGIIRNNLYIAKNTKIADIDPRIQEQKNCFTISDKARTIGGAVLQAILYLMHQRRGHQRRGGK